MPFATGLTAIDAGTVLVLITVVVAPIAAVAFARSGAAWRSIGKGPLAIEPPAPEPAPREGSPPAEEAAAAELRAEVRQLVISRNERRRRQGRHPLDVEEETRRQLEYFVGSRR